MLSNVVKYSHDALNIDLMETNFLWSIFHAFLNFALWMIVPHLEFKYKIISRFTKDAGRANDFFSFFLIHTGALRNLAFNEAINKGLKLSYGSFALPLEILGALMAAAGSIIIIFTFFRMGIRGMYFGDYFGFLFKEKITAFPFSHLDNPQYVGTTSFFLGCSIYYHSPCGAILTLLTYALYMLLNVVESKNLEIFYPSNKDTKEKSN